MLRGSTGARRRSRHCVTAWTSTAFCAVVGGSGVGKSSLVYSGLLPRLEEEANWYCLEMMPRGAPRDALARAFVSLLLQAGLIDAEEATSAPLIDHVRTMLRRSAFGVVDLVNDWLAACDRRVLLLVDQFEEIFRFAPQGHGLHSTEDEAAPFVSSLLTAAAASATPVHVVLTMRADYIGDCIRFEGLPEAVSDGQYLVPRLTREEVESVIRQPVVRAGAAIDHDLVEQLLNDCANQPDALPVLQHVLMRLWDARRPGQGEHRRLTIDTYNAVGRMRDALSRHADSVIAELGATTLGEKAEPAVATVMRALTEVDHKGRGIRRPIPFGQLVEETGFGEPEVTLVVDAMRSHHRSFLRPDPQVTLTDDTIIDIGHEALIRLWRKIEDYDDHEGRSKGWLRGEERDGRIYRALLEYAEESERGDGAPLPPGQAESRQSWWNEQNRTERWARRYGGGWARVVKLIERSMSFRPHRLVSASATNNKDELLAKSQDTLKRLAGICDDEDLAEAKKLVEALRDQALYEEMGALAEAVSRRDPKDARNRRLYGQYLIRAGRATAAIDLLTSLAQRLPRGDPEFAETMGLLGQANKQIFFDAGDKADPSAHAALGQAVAAYRVPFEESPEKNTWHGVNLLALLYRARRLGLQIAPDLSPRQIAMSVVAELAAMPKEKHDPVWYLPTLAEASLALGDWDVVEGNVRAYAASDQVRPFQIESTLRQFTEVWDIEALDERGRGLVATLRARLLQLTGGEIRASAEDVQRWREQAPPTPGQLEAILGSEGPQTYRWWRTGLERAASVCTVRQKLGQRFGSGFLLKAGALGLQPPDEPVVLTNFHVVNKEGALGALTPESAEVAFEAADAAQTWPVKTILWSSQPARHDASVLRLQGAVAGIVPLSLAPALPPIENNAKVYIIGSPRGQNVAFSFQDSELLDHEGPPSGAPQIPGVSRVHYRTPTEPVSSGSPVFDATGWAVIALHHKGSKDELPRLNGKAGSYAANEGISIVSIKGAIERGDVEGH
jgi:Trypsin-like peptidase domain